ncbi:similar to Saccharomyces cerevisiae YGR250C Putative RNA binding protein [Maudiozyma barnettii]|nr:similar to Saccharomyces cerevisiae YGR250C Putative RNA binding protein [Kazachstania barnettii]
MSETEKVSQLNNDVNKEQLLQETDIDNVAGSVSSAGLQLEQLANKNLLTVRIKWSSKIADNEIEKDKIILEFSNYIVSHKGNIINPLKIENYEYLCDSKRLEVITENHYEFEHGSKEFAKSYLDTAKNWMFDIVQQAHFRKGYSLENCAIHITNALKELPDVIERWSVTINHHALTHTGNLFIGGISKKITITKLMDIFKEYGPLVSIKLIHDKLKDRAIGYGFVSYQLGSHASKCIQMLNGKEIEGSTLFINYHVDRKERENLHWNQVKENFDEKTFKCLFIGNLPKLTDTSNIVTEDMVLKLLTGKLLEKFPNFTILSYYFPKDSNKNRNDVSEQTTLKGYGFIKVGSSDEIQHVIDQFNGFQWFGNSLVVNKAVQNRIQSSNQKGTVNNDGGGAFINGTNHNYYHNRQYQEKSVISSRGSDVVDQQIPQYVKNIYQNYYNDPSSIRVNSNVSVPTSILGDKSSPMMNIPVNLNNEPTYEGPNLLPNMYMNSLPIPLSNQQESNLYVKHIPLDWTDEILTEFYECFGIIISSKVITIGGSSNQENSSNSNLLTENENTTEEEEVIGSSKGYGFVCFENPIDASRAILATNGYQLNNGSVLSVSFANKKNNNNNVNNNSRNDNHNGSNNENKNSSRNRDIIGENNGFDNFCYRGRGNISTNGINNQMPYNKKFMNALMQQQNQLLVSPSMNMPPAPIQNFPMYMNTVVNNVPYFPVSAYNTMPFQYPR